MLSIANPLRDCKFSIMDYDTPMKDSNRPTGVQEHFCKDYVVAVDFGTTYSAVAYVALEDSTVKRRIRASQIQVIDEYPYDPSELGFGFELRKDVPTELWYPVKSIRQNPITSTLFQNDDNSESVSALNDGRNDSIWDDVMRDESDEDLAHNESNIHYDHYLDSSEEEKFYWGYGVHKQLKATDLHGDDTSKVARFKLMLDSTEYTENIRKGLKQTFRQLKRYNLIKSPSDTISDYLARLFLHTKRKLAERHQLSDCCSVEFVLCVPAAWKSKACREMQAAMERALRKADFGMVDRGGINNLFLVSEPEAASAYVLEGGDSVLGRGISVNLDVGDHVLILQCHLLI